MLEAKGLPEEEAHPARHGLATFLAFVLAGAIPLLPYALGWMGQTTLLWSMVLTLSTMFVVGASRAAISAVRWWRGGLEMLILGAVVAGVAYWSGSIVAGLLG